MFVVAFLGEIVLLILVPTILLLLVPVFGFWALWMKVYWRFCASPLPK